MMNDPSRSLVLAQVIGIKESNFTYPSCYQCCSKVYERSGEDHDLWQCLKCKAILYESDVSHRYRLNFSITDDSAVCDVTVFGRNVEQIFGCSAFQFQRYIRAQHDDTDGKLTRIIEEVMLGRLFFFGFKSQPVKRRDSEKIFHAPITLATIIANSTQTKSGHCNTQQVPCLIAYQIIPVQDQGQFPTVIQALNERPETQNQNTLNWNTSVTVASSCTVPNDSYANSTICSLRSSLISNLEMTYGQQSVRLSCESTSSNTAVNDECQPDLIRFLGNDEQDNHCTNVMDSEIENEGSMVHSSTTIEKEVHSMSIEQQRCAVQDVEDMSLDDINFDQSILVDKELANDSIQSVGLSMSIQGTLAVHHHDNVHSQIDNILPGKFADIVLNEDCDFDETLDPCGDFLQPVEANSLPVNSEVLTLDIKHTNSDTAVSPFEYIDEINISECTDSLQESDASTCFLDDYHRAVSEPSQFPTLQLTLGHVKAGWSESNDGSQELLEIANEEKPENQRPTTSNSVRLAAQEVTLQESTSIESEIMQLPHVEATEKAFDSTMKEDSQSLCAFPEEEISFSEDLDAFLKDMTSSQGTQLEVANGKVTNAHYPQGSQHNVVSKAHVECTKMTNNSIKSTSPIHTDTCMNSNTSTIVGSGESQITVITQEQTSRENSASIASRNSPATGLAETEGNSNVTTGEVNSKTSATAETEEAEALLLENLSLFLEEMVESFSEQSNTNSAKANSSHECLLHRNASQPPFQQEDTAIATKAVVIRDHNAMIENVDQRHYDSETVDYSENGSDEMFVSEDMEESETQILSQSNRISGISTNSCALGMNSQSMNLFSSASELFSNSYVDLDASQTESSAESKNSSGGSDIQEQFRKGVHFGASEAATINEIDNMMKVTPRIERKLRQKPILKTPVSFVPTALSPLSDAWKGGSVISSQMDLFSPSPEVTMGRQSDQHADRTFHSTPVLTALSGDLGAGNVSFDVSLSSSLDEFVIPTSVRRPPRHRLFQYVHNRGLCQSHINHGKSTASANKENKASAVRHADLVLFSELSEELSMSKDNICDGTSDSDLIIASSQPLFSNPLTVLSQNATLDSSGTMQSISSNSVHSSRLFSSEPFGGESDELFSDNSWEENVDICKKLF